MKLGTIVKTSFILSFIITIAGVYLKTTHSEGSEVLLIAAVITSLTFIVSAIYEVRTSKRINSSEKTMWTIAFIFMSGIAGLFYLINSRKRIAENL